MSMPARLWAGIVGSRPRTYITDVATLREAKQLTNTRCPAAGCTFILTGWITDKDDRAFRTRCRCGGSRSS